MVTAGPFIFIVYMYVMFMIFSVKDWSDMRSRIYLTSTDYIVMLVCNLDALGGLGMH